MKIDQVKMFCDKEGDFSEPFNFDGFTYATTKKMGIRVTSDMIVEGPPQSNVEYCKMVAIADVFNKTTFVEAEYIHMPEKLEAVERKCLECNGMGYIEDCPECCGYGMVSLDTEYNTYEVECMTCNGGEDKDKIKCIDCNGTGLDNKPVVNLNGSFIYLDHAEKISKLPNVKISKKEYMNSILFKFNYGEGIVMTVIETHG